MSLKSPDLNPLEHLWNELEQSLRAGCSLPGSMEKVSSCTCTATCREGSEEEHCKHETEVEGVGTARQCQSQHDLVMMMMMVTIWKKEANQGCDYHAMFCPSPSLVLKDLEFELAGRIKEQNGFKTTLG